MLRTITNYATRERIILQERLCIASVFIKNIRFKPNEYSSPLKRNEKELRNRLFGSYIHSVS